MMGKCNVMLTLTHDLKLARHTTLGHDLGCENRICCVPIGMKAEVSLLKSIGTKFRVNAPASTFACAQWKQSFNF